MTSLAHSPDTTAEPARKRRSPAEHGTRLPEGWRRSEADIAWQRRENIPDSFARLSTQRFRNYWLSVPGSRGKKLNWSRTWQNWVLGDWMGLTDFRREEWRQADRQRPNLQVVPEALR